MDQVWVRPYRKCQLWLIPAVFSGRGCLGMRNTMVKPKMSLPPDLLAKQEVSTFSRLLLIDPRHFLKEGASQGARQTESAIIFPLVTVWRAKQEVKSFWTSPTCSASLETPILNKAAWINQYIWQENADTSCIPVKFVGFPLYFPQTFHWLKLGSVC